MMRIDRSENGLVCTYCGRDRDYNEEICECGKSVSYMSRSEEDYFYYGYNNIDNLMIDKRSGRYNNV